MNCRLSWLVVAALLAAAWPGRGEDTVSLKRGDSIVFCGDSITQHGTRPYGYVSLVRQALDRHFRNEAVKVVGIGRGNCTLAGLRDRLDKDILALKANIVVVEIGIADLYVAGAEKDLRKRIFAMGMEDLVWRIRRSGARPVLTTLTLAGERHDGSNKLDPLLEEYSQIIRDVAADKKCQVIELRSQFMHQLKEINTENVRAGLLTTRGGIHLNPAGNRLMAKLVLEAFKIPVKGDWWDAENNVQDPLLKRKKPAARGGAE